MDIYLGEFIVEEVSSMGRFAINVGNNVRIICHIGDFPHTLKNGNKVPLYTKVPYNASALKPLIK
jgi:hypothetical protein